MSPLAMANEKGGMALAMAREKNGIFCEYVCSPALVPLQLSILHILAMVSKSYVTAKSPHRRTRVPTTRSRLGDPTAALQPPSTAGLNQ